MEHKIIIFAFGNSVIQSLIISLLQEMCSRSIVDTVFSKAALFDFNKNPFDIKIIYEIGIMNTNIMITK